MEVGIGLMVNVIIVVPVVSMVVVVVVVVVGADLSILMVWA